MPIGAHHSPVMLKDEWLTPPYILEALGKWSVDKESKKKGKRK